MATITNLGANDSGSLSRTTINDNFTNLNSDKIETSVLSTDGTLAGDSDTEIPSEKAVKTYVDTEVAGATSISVETTTGVTHSLTTTAGQVVCVWAKGNQTSTSGVTNIYLNYNAVQKDTVVSRVSSSGDDNPFCLMYTETPGAATQDITVTIDAGTIENVVIMVQIIG